MFFVCTVTDFSAAKKGSGVKLRMLVRLLSGQVFSHFGELRLAWSHGGGITSGMSYIQIAVGPRSSGGRRGSICSRNWGRRRREMPYGGICVLQAC